MALSRRAALKAIGGTAGAAALVPWLSDEGLLAYSRIQATGAPPQLLVLSPAQYATLEAFVENLEQVPDGVFQRPTKLNCVEVSFKRSIAKMGRHYIPGRVGVTTDGNVSNYKEPMRETS
ncbi:hypothetical protein BH24ACI4_BH24ACI4_33110 [soil metagenome]